MAKRPRIKKSLAWKTKLEKPEVDTFLQAILQRPETANWSREDYTINQCHTIPVLEGTAEYTEVVDQIRRSPWYPCPFHIHKLWRIQNPFMLGQFLLKREERSKENLLESSSMTPNVSADKTEAVEKQMSEETMNTVQPITLFHGTTEQALEGIFKNNFDWKLCQKGLYGRGVSFSPYPNYAKYYGHQGGHRIMILANVLVGKTCFGHSHMTVPTPGTDTAVRWTNDAVYVKFDEDEFYPAYVFEYTPDGPPEPSVA